MIVSIRKHLKLHIFIQIKDILSTKGSLLNRRRVTIAIQEGQSATCTSLTDRLTTERTEGRTAGEEEKQEETLCFCEFCVWAGNSPSAVSMTLVWWLLPQETPRTEATWGRSVWRNERSDSPVTSGGAEWLSVVSGRLGVKRSLGLLYDLVSK